ncbi:MAG: N-acetylmuramoyl-L-alanine amidase [Gemmatimonadaceae bacterium]
MNSHPGRTRSERRSNITRAPQLSIGAMLQALLLATGCAGAPITPAASPTIASAAPPTGSPVRATASTQKPIGAMYTGETGLPPVPRVSGAPLNPRVQYPAENQLVASRDSNFILGSIGSGDASLSINGVPVAVAANGAFIGWLQNPPATNPTYELVAARGADTVRRTLRIRMPIRTPLLATGKLRVDSSSISPNSRSRMRGDELVRVSVRAPLNAKAWLQIDTTRIAMVTASLTQSNIDRSAHGEQTLSLDVALPANEDVGGTFYVEVPAQRIANPVRGNSAAVARVIVGRGSDTVRLAVSPPTLVDPMTRIVGVLRPQAKFESDTDRVVNARPIPEGTYKWLLLPGTVVEMTGKQGSFTRVRLDSNLEVWVENNDIVQLPEGTPIPRRLSGGLRVIPAKDWADVIIPLGERPPFIVEPDGHTLMLTLYGSQINPDISPIIGNDTLIRQISWDQVATDRVRIELRLSQTVYGWLSLWDETRHALVLRVRRLPTINPDKPLAGLTIAVDPGHPPAGATGPTGLYEGDAVLPVGELVAQMFRDKGATAIMTRTTKAPVGLTERTVTSRRANANAFISIHLNAFGDGTNPFSNNGTSTLFFHQSSEPLARPVQRELQKRFGLRDLGVHYQNLAVARPTWYPAVLTEGVFVIMPEQEAAMRDPAFLRRYAEGIVAGFEQYFRDLSKQ